MLCSGRVRHPQIFEIGIGMGVANGKWHSLLLFAHLQPFREAHPMSGGRDRDIQTNTHSVDILGRAFNVCSLCDPRHKKDKQTNSH